MVHDVKSAVWGKKHLKAIYAHLECAECAESEADILANIKLAAEAATAAGLPKMAAKILKFT
jgi:hypothetical protein